MLMLADSAKLISTITAAIRKTLGHFADFAVLSVYCLRNARGATPTKTMFFGIYFDLSAKINYKGRFRPPFFTPIRGESRIDAHTIVCQVAEFSILDFPGAVYPCIRYSASNVDRNLMEDPIITTREAAEILGVSVRTAQTWIEENALDSWKTPGGHRRIRRSAVTDLKAKLAAEKIDVPALVLVHAPQHKTQRLVEMLSVLPECAVHASSDTVQTSLCAGHLLPSVIVVDDDSTDCMALVEHILELPALGHTHVVMTGLPEGTENPAFQGVGRRIHLLDGSASASIIQTTVRRLLADDGALKEPAAGPLKGRPAGNEARRLRAVTASGLVDTPTEETFDEITRLAAAILEAPIALLTLLTPDRQWFKSRWGLETTETPRSWAFCNFTILQDDVFVVEDATIDMRFADNPLVTGSPHIRFYAGVNIRDSQGYPLGSLCVIDRIPRRLPKSQRDALNTLGHLASDRINLRIMERKLRWAAGQLASHTAISGR